MTLPIHPRLFHLGDSWCDYPGFSLPAAMQEHYGWKSGGCSRGGSTLEGWAYEPAHMERFKEELQKSPKPDVLLLSVGGNDVIGGGKTFPMLLNHAQSGWPILDHEIANTLINGRLLVALRTLLSKIEAVCREVHGKPLPLALHGYAYPLPDGKGFEGGGWFLPGPWLKPGFRAKGWEFESARMAMRDLIDEFNEMLRLACLFDAYADWPVIYVDLREKIDSEPETYERDWENEMHLSRRGWTVAAQEVDRRLREVL